MNDEIKILNLINRLNAQIHRDGSKSPSVSPTFGFMGGSSSRKTIKTVDGKTVITKHIRLEDISDNMLYLIHAQLHQYYGAKHNKYLTKEDIKILHKKIKQLITHVDFDKLDND